MENENEPQEGALILDEHDSGSAPLPVDDGAKAEEAAGTIEELLDLMDLDADVDIREDDEEIVLDVTGPDAGRAIGKKGQTLDALQFLVNKIVNRFPEGRRHVVVDSGDYRERHDDGLITMATREATRAVDEGHVVSLQPMSARDRRVIHLSLAKFEGVTTESSGEGRDRRIEIIPAGASRGGGARRRRRRRS